MRNLNLIIIFLIAPLLSSCGCGCNLVDTTVSSGLQTLASTVTVFADGCSSEDGVVDSSGVPQQICDGNSGQPYLNRGRWVQSPNIGTTNGTQLEISVQNSIYFCSTGYDNQNPSPSFVVTPGHTVTNSFVDGSQLSISPGDIINIITANDNIGVTVGSGTSGVTTSCSTYSALTSGNCRGKLGFGLSIYLDNKELVTLDSMYQPSSTYFPYAQFRQPYLFSGIQPNQLQTYFTDTNSDYNINYTNYGYGQYSFMVPGTSSGKIGFAIAQGAGSSGSGSYTLTVNTTPKPCLVVAAAAGNKPGQRGALQLLLSASNPNDVDDVISNFNSLNNGNEISVYYPSLLKYLATVQNVTISSNAQSLSALVTPSAPNITPTAVITGPEYIIPVALTTGNIWYKVLDDYYNDNVGQYIVTTKAITKTAGMASQFLNDLISPFVQAVSQASWVIYHNFTYAEFMRIVKLSLILYIILYGMQFALGLVSISGQDVFIRIFKLAVVIELFQPNSWDFFNHYFFQLFISGRDQLIATITGDYSTNKVGVFGFVDNLFNVFFAPGTWLKVIALLPYVVGFLFLVGLIFVIIMYVFIIAKVIVSYLLAVVTVSFLVSLAPIFITLLIFNRTKKYFDNWIKVLVDYALQPVLMFTVLYITNLIFMELWNATMNFKVCYGGVYNIYFPLKSWTKGLIDNWSLGCIQGYKPTELPNFFGLFVAIFSLALIAISTRALVAHVPAITKAITGLETASAVERAASSTISNTIDVANKMTAHPSRAIRKTANFVARNVENSVGSATRHIFNKMLGRDQNGNKPKKKRRNFNAQND